MLASLVKDFVLLLAERKAKIFCINPLDFRLLGYKYSGNETLELCVIYLVIIIRRDNGQSRGLNF